MPEKPIYKFEDFQLNTEEHLLLRGIERINLSPRTFDLLVKLVENAGHLLEKETLIRKVWADSIVEEGNLNRTISNLRKSLGEKPNENRFIETVPRIGYRFIADVFIEEQVKADKESVGQRNSQNQNFQVQKSINQRTTTKFLLMIAALILIAGGISVFLAWTNLRTDSILKSTDESFYEPLRLTDNPNNDSHPQWTKDGRIRFFRTDAKFQTESLIMNADGRNQVVVKDFPAMKYGYWSPNGEKVIFAKPNDKTAFYLANADGTGEVSLPFFSGNFDWSFDSSQIVYQKNVNQTNSEIFIYTIETAESKNISNHPQFDADPSFAPDGKKIVFISDRDENAEIYTMNSDGSDVRRLTNHPSADSHPVFSPDGTQIAFTSDLEAENADIYLLNSDGGGKPKRLTFWESNETLEPGGWSPDGTKIAFFSNHDGGKTDEIYVMSAEIFRPQKVLADAENNLGFPSYSPDGKKIVYQAELENKNGELRIFDVEKKSEKVIAKTKNPDISPAWSPDGNWIAFQNKIEENTEICLIKPDGSSFVNLTNNTAKDTSPAWSPDSKKIAFTSNRGGNFGLFQIYLMHADGTNQQRIYFSGGISSAPAWSRDGRKIIFSNDKEDGRSGNFELFSIEPETSEPEKRLTFRRRYDVSPDFSPDGKYIVFVSETDGNSEIYLMKNDGTGILRLTRNPSEDISPHWSPDGNRIIFSSNRSGKFAIYEVSISP